MEIDWSSISLKILALVASSLLMAIGYMYRSRKQYIENRKKALHTLLQIWFQASVFYRTNLSKDIEHLISEFKKHLPEDYVTDHDIHVIRNELPPIMLKVIREIAMSDIGDYLAEFESVIALISKDDPLLAFNMSSSNDIKKSLSHIDSYFKNVATKHLLDNSSQLELADKLTLKITENVQTNALQNMEANLLKLSRKISPYTTYKVWKIISERKFRLQNTSAEIIEHYVKEILLPVLHETGHVTIGSKQVQQNIM